MAEESKEPDHRIFKTKLSPDGTLVAYVRRDGKAHTMDLVFSNDRDGSCHGHVANADVSVTAGAARPNGLM